MAKRPGEPNSEQARSAERRQEKKRTGAGTSEDRYGMVRSGVVREICDGKVKLWLDPQLPYRGMQDGQSDQRWDVTEDAHSGGRGRPGDGLVERRGRCEGGGRRRRMGRGRRKRKGGPGASAGAKQGYTGEAPGYFRLGEIGDWQQLTSTLPGCGLSSPGSPGAGSLLSSDHADPSTCFHLL